MDGKQVAMLVPTTILAQQHLDTFNQRMGEYPVKIDILSRFRSPAEQAETVRRVADGAIDIIIGTHRLIQRDITFANLGLLIIDEEQRFGVADKERLKKLRKEVDVLTLTATPIPRTLHMALVGVRGISVMESPPPDRQAVKTYVTGYDDQIVRRAILAEQDREGQVYFVHNRVQTIGRHRRPPSQVDPRRDLRRRPRPHAVRGTGARPWSSSPPARPTCSFAPPSSRTAWTCPTSTPS